MKEGIRWRRGDVRGKEKIWSVVIMMGERGRGEGREEKR